MKRNSNIKGFTLIEMLIGTLCMTILGLGIFEIIRTSYDSQWMLMNQNNANLSARTGVDTMADKLRGMTTLSSATATSVQYSDSTGLVRYWLNTADHTLRTNINDSPSVGTIAVRGMTGLTFKYYSWNGAAWTSSLTPSPLNTVGAIDITATVSLNGYLRQVYSSVKLRQIRFNNMNGF
jgi:type II secretory pathway pseudopilin PulG